MNFKEHIFVNPNSLIDTSADVIFVSDMFVEDYIGGAELTTEAIIEESPFRVQKIHSSKVNLALLEQGLEKFWIFGNFSHINAELIPTIIANLKYSVLEYDYKYCKYRSPEKHENLEKSECNCHEQMNGKLISAFYYGAQCMWWMSEAQKKKYNDLFPFLKEKDSIVLSSVFSKNMLGLMTHIKDQVKVQNIERKGWIVLGSSSWVKGAEEAKKWCEENSKDYEIVWNLSYKELLSKLAVSEGFVYLPVGADTCPRMVIEAKLLGCKLHVNDYVQHAKEDWFNTEDLDSIKEYLFAAPDLFWKVTRNLMNKSTKISGYTTTYNCISQGYPFEKSIRSMIQFCEEVCVVDGGSSDGTYDALKKIADEVNTSDFQKLKIKVVQRDWSSPRFGVFDGMQKAEARSMCTGDFCWQMDSDEIVHEDDADKISHLCEKMPQNVEVISLPVVEYWGGSDKVRADIQPWKWRLSKNLPHITHGIPKDLRRTDSNGEIYAAPGTDGCDMIHKETGERIPHVTFHSQQTEILRNAAISGNKDALEQYKVWFNKVVNTLPGVHHYSWHDITRKIRLYRDFWTKHWNSLYNGSLEDTAETNMMFDVPWSQVTEEMIEAKAKDLKEKTGGWIWHRKWTGESIPFITVDRKEPK